MKTAVVGAAILTAVGSLTFCGQASARAPSVTVTGVVSNIDPVTRIATITPTNGPPVVVQFNWNIGGPCDKCLGGGLVGPVFVKTVTEGSVWTVTYTSSIPAGAASWFPGGTIHTVYMAIRSGEETTSARDKTGGSIGESGAP